MTEKFVRNFAEGYCSSVEESHGFVVWLSARSGSIRLDLDAMRALLDEYRAAVAR